MPTNIVDTATYTNPIVAPASGDPRTAASVETMGQGLANRTAYLGSFISSGLFPTINSEKADTNAGAEIASLVHKMGQSATSRFWLWQSCLINGVAGRLRMYQDAQQNGSLVITYNAAWDADTDQWVKDATGAVATKFAIGSSGGFVVQFVDAATAGPFAEGSWNANLGLFGSDGARAVLTLAGWMATSVTPSADTLYSNNMIKAWASVTVASSVITVHDSFNMGTPSLQGTTDLRLPFRTNMLNNVYCAIPSVHNTANSSSTVLRATTHFDIRAIDLATQLGVDLTSNTRAFSVIVMGQQ
jgi:hypothetical protein